MAASSGDTIALAPGCAYALASANDYQYGPSAFALGFNKNITINGQGATLTVDHAATQNLRIFYIYSGATLTLQNVTLDSGAAAGGNGGLGLAGGGGGAGMGGAIYNEQGTVTIVATTFSGTAAYAGSGGTDAFRGLAPSGQGLANEIYNGHGTIYYDYSSGAPATAPARPTTAPAHRAAAPASRPPA